MLEKEIQPGFTELACHPGYVTDDFKSEYAVEREIELRSICNSNVKQRITELNIELVSFSRARELLGSMVPTPMAS